MREGKKPSKFCCFVMNGSCCRLDHLVAIRWSGSNVLDFIRKFPYTVYYRFEKKFNKALQGKLRYLLLEIKTVLHSKQWIYFAASECTVFSLITVVNLLNHADVRVTNLSYSSFLYSYICTYVKVVFQLSVHWYAKSLHNNAIRFLFLYYCFNYDLSSR